MFIDFRKRIRRTAAQTDLPEPTIQLVQSFLTYKEAARTTLLSKSWRSAWLTRPNLDLDMENFWDYEFLEFVERTLERYENSNLNIHSFRMSIKNWSYSAIYGTLTKLVRVLKLGPTRLTFEFPDYYFYHLPNEVFKYESLLSLTAQNCEISPNRDEVCCSRLQFLSFNHIRIKSIFHILSSCPLIEKLSLCNVYVDVDRDPYSVGYGLDLLTIISPLHRLKSLVLKHVNFDTLLLADLSSKLPSLKDLTLHIRRDRKEILISSPTLERLDFNIGEYYGSSYTAQVVKLHVPRIRKLTFACTNIPDELSIISNSKRWESFVSITNVKCLNASWFYRLSNFIDKIKFSRISLLSLHVSYKGLFDYEAGDVQGLPTPKIENLTIYNIELIMTTKSCYAIFDGLFQMCHPKVINIRIVPIYRTNIINFLEERILAARDAKVQTPNQYYLMHGLNEYIKEASAQVFDWHVSTWRDVTEGLLLDENSTTLRYSQDFRFHLKWKE